MTSTNGHSSHVANPASVGSDASPGPAATAPAALTAREGEVAWMIAAGLSTRRIAAALAVSGRTVEWHVANIQRKLGLQSRLQIALWALQHGEHPPPV